jgi:hypothetical protein
MAKRELTCEVIEGLARAAGVDTNAVPVDLLLKGDLPIVWEGINKFDALNIQNEIPAFVTYLVEEEDGR